MKKFFGCAALVVALLAPTPASASKPTSSKVCSPLVALYRELLKIEREQPHDSRQLEVDAWETVARDAPEALKAELEFMAQWAQHESDGDAKALVKTIRKRGKVEGALRDYLFENCPHAHGLYYVFNFAGTLMLDGYAADDAQCAAKHFVADLALWDAWIDARESGAAYPKDVRDMLEACKKLPHV